MTRSTSRPDPKLDLVLERIVDVPRELVWRAWTTPEHVKKWFTPAPWTTVDCEIDLCAGGIFRTETQSPEGERSSQVACYLEVIENERLVWTLALLPGFRPTNQKSDLPPLTVIITFQTHGKGTKYTATVMHKDEDDCRKHDEMGFLEGWGAATDQLIACARALGQT